MPAKKKRASAKQAKSPAFDAPTHTTNHQHAKSFLGEQLRDLVLGGQDGLVNVLGIVLGVAAATSDPRIVIVAGLAATFAESISMGAVAYTSTKAALSYYNSELQREKDEIKTKPDEEVREIRDIYYAKGFRGTLLNRIVQHITSDEKLWLDTMMAEELKLSSEQYGNPLRSALVVGLAAFAGSLIPLWPFFFLPIQTSVWLAVASAVITLFTTGAIKAKLTVGTWWKSGLEITIIGMTAALAGYLIGALMGAGIV